MNLINPEEEEIKLTPAQTAYKFGISQVFDSYVGDYNEFDQETISLDIAGVEHTFVV